MAKETGAKFTIRAVETTDDKPDFKGKKTGWHYHSHTLVFFERDKAFTEQEAKHFSELFQQMWVKALNGVGLEGSIERAARVDLPRANDLLDEARATENEENLKTCAPTLVKLLGGRCRVAGVKRQRKRSACVSVGTTGSCAYNASQIVVALCRIYASCS